MRTVVGGGRDTHDGHENSPILVFFSNLLVLIGEGARRRAVREFVAHDHHERNPQGLDNRLILPLATAPPPRGRVPCRQRLGGMLHYYYRSAA